MADLDDFFKKRDKKKKTTKSKFSTLDTEEFAKQLEATTVRTIEDDAELQENGELNIVPPIPAIGENVDEEWKPFDSEENKDYTGLRIKIQNWKVEDEENNNEGVDVEQEKKAACPWGVCSGTNKQDDETVDDEGKSEEPVKVEVPEPKKPEPEPAPAPAPTSSYVPPHLRKQQQAAAPAPVEKTSAYVPPSLRKAQESGQAPRRQKAQPNIMDTMEFPTLNAVPVETGEKQTNVGERFELPKKSGRVEPKTAGSSIEIENKFGALSSTNN